MGTQTVADSKPEQEKRLAEALRRALNFRLDRVRGLAITPDLAQDQAKQEATFGTVTVDTNGMTPGMKLHLLQPTRAFLSEWRTARLDFDTELQPKMADIRAVFDADKEVAKAEQDRAEKLAAIERKLEASPAYIKMRDHKDLSQLLWKRYSDVHSGRQPTMFAKSHSYKVILLFIGVAEWFINYDTLLNFTGVPAIAAGSTILLAVLLAFAADAHGELLKQWSHRFNESRTPAQRARDWRLLGLSFIALLVVLGAAGAARYSAALQVIQAAGQRSIIVGLDGSGPDPMRDVLISMLANVAAWIVGIFLSYAAHDEDPEYVDATRQWNTAHRVWTQSRAKYEKDIRHVQANCDKTIKDRRAAAKTRADSVENELNMLKQIEAHDCALDTEVQQVLLSNIETYRAALSKTVLAASGHIQIKSIVTNASMSPFELNTIPLPSREAIQTLLAA